MKHKPETWVAWRCDLNCLHTLHVPDVRCDGNRNNIKPTRFKVTELSAYDRAAAERDEAVALLKRQQKEALVHCYYQQPEDESLDADTDVFLARLNDQTKTGE